MWAVRYIVTPGRGPCPSPPRLKRPNKRLLIARALATKPRIFIMDEATSALDTRTQTIVSESLTALQATRVVIAHRLSTIVKADCIYYIDKGRVVQSGTYAELMRQGGPFSEQARRQLS
jgi:ABC-type multidrug transport system fused ATPase/permease subunit